MNNDAYMDVAEAVAAATALNNNDAYMDVAEAVAAATALNNTDAYMDIGEAAAAAQSLGAAGAMGGDEPFQVEGEFEGKDGDLNRKRSVYRPLVFW
jgi:hypothetical protein